MSDIAARLRNLFARGTLKRRKNDDDTVQVATRFGRAVEGLEFFPYGFISRAPEGTTVTFFEGGDVRSPIILPVSSRDGAPSLEVGDSGLWTKDGGWIVARKSGSVELYGNQYGGIIKVDELKSQLEKITQWISVFNNTLQTAGSSPIAPGSPVPFLVALLPALGAVQVADFSQIESDKVFHGDGSA